MNVNRRRGKREGGLAAAAALTLFVGGPSSLPGAGCNGEAEDEPAASAVLDPGDAPDGCGGGLGPGPLKMPPACGEA